MRPSDAGPGTPGRRPASRRVQWAAWATVASVVPSAVWRVAVGVGVDLGWSDTQLASQDIPGSGTVYVIVLSALSLGAASLTLLLVTPDGDRVPRWVPVIGGRRVPLGVVTAVAMTGAVAVAWICVQSVRNWDRVSGFADRPGSGWATLMAACYAPALLWGPLLAIVTLDHRSRTRASAASRVAIGV